MLQHWGENNSKVATAWDALKEWTAVAIALPAVLAQVLFIFWAAAQVLR